jgi:hypothetical protein
MGVKLQAASGGSVELVPTNTASTYTLTVPAVTGTVVLQETKITSGTAVASTSGTSIDFTSIPSWVKRITVMFDQVSTNGASLAKLQIGSAAGGFASSGYNAAAWTTYSSNGTQTTYFPLENLSSGAAMSRCGSVVLTNLSGNIWTLTGGMMSLSGPYSANLYGSATISSTLDRIRITTANGTDTFDAGSINILYE